jgi:hypothetical protein
LAPQNKNRAALNRTASVGKSPSKRRRRSLDKIPARPAQVGGDLQMVTYPLEKEQDDEYCNVYPDVPAADPAGWREYRLRR